MSFSVRLDSLHESDFVVEAIVENFEAKRTTFQKLDAITPKHAILASNTSSISITKIAGSVPSRSS